MTITIETQVPLVTVDYLESPFLSAQQKRVTQITAIIAAAQEKIKAWRRANPIPQVPSVPGKGLSPEGTAQRRAIQQHYSKIETGMARQFRLEADGEILLILKQCRDAAAEAKVLAERQFDKFSLLRRSTGGLSKADAWAERVSLSQVLAKTGPVELARWAQWALDAADPVIADAVIRENNSRKTDDRGFVSAALLTALPLPDFDRAQALLTQVVNLANDVGVTYSEFARGKADGTARIAIGLRKAHEIHLAEGGSIEALPVAEGEANA